MTRKEFMEKYGDVEMSFQSYYKYTFYYEGKVGEYSVVCSYGGCAEDIYRHEVYAGGEESLRSVDPDTATVYDPSGKEVDTF